MAHHGRRDKSSTLPVGATTTTEGSAAAAAVGATARVKNASVSHKAPSHPPHTSQGGSHRRRSPQGQLPKVLSPSQTHHRSSMSDAEKDKKRNKLDYTRISVACVHCRRRKIRCQANESDPSEKCGNCIKFNKECVFHPVDPHQMSTPQRPQASASALALSSAPRQQSSSVSSSPTDVGLEEHAYGAYVPLAPHGSGSSHPGVVQSYNPATAISGPALDPTTHPTHAAQSPWQQYHGAFQPNYPGQYLHQYPSYMSSISPASTGDFSPYPPYSPTHGQPLYSGMLSPTTSMEMPIPSSGPTSQQWSIMPSSSVGYAPQNYLHLPTTTLSQSAFADPTYYSGTSDSTQTTEADVWYNSNYGSEEHYDTPPDAKPYGGR